MLNDKKHFRTTSSFYNARSFVSMCLLYDYYDPVGYVDKCPHVINLKTKQKRNKLCEIATNIYTKLLLININVALL